MIHIARDGESPENTEYERSSRRHLIYIIRYNRIRKLKKCMCVIMASEIASRKRKRLASKKERPYKA